MLSAKQNWRISNEQTESPAEHFTVYQSRLKENIATAGQPVSLGLPSRERNIATEDAVVVAQAKSEGAIVMAKTNTPQLLLSFECQNPLYGVTRNPFALDRSSGGSSGGEQPLSLVESVPAGLGPISVAPFAFQQRGVEFTVSNQPREDGPSEESCLCTSWARAGLRYGRANGTLHQRSVADDAGSVIAKAAPT